MPFKMRHARVGRLPAKSEGMTSDIFEEFVATLAHELRTPLNAILGYARLLKSGKLDSAAAENALDCLYRNAERQVQLVSDLLDASSILHGKLELNMAPLDLSAVIQDVLDCIRIEAESKSIRICCDIENIDGVVIGDARRLQQVGCNLLTNAIKFSPSGGSINVRLRSRGGHAEISVADTGVGLSEEFLPHVFEKFRQADISQVRRNGGLGLGLAIVREVVTMHDGIVEAQSKGVGRGATFTVKLPLQPVALTAGLA
jgi:signal transduction histidine kinase